MQPFGPAPSAAGYGRPTSRGAAVQLRFRWNASWVRPGRHTKHVGRVGQIGASKCGNQHRNTHRLVLAASANYQGTFCKHLMRSCMTCSSTFTASITQTNRMEHRLPRFIFWLFWGFTHIYSYSGQLQLAIVSLATYHLCWVFERHEGGEAACRHRGRRGGMYTRGAAHNRRRGGMYTRG